MKVIQGLVDKSDFCSSLMYICCMHYLYFSFIWGEGVYLFANPLLSVWYNHIDEYVCWHFFRWLLFTYPIIIYSSNDWKGRKRHFPPVCLRAAAHAIKPGALGGNQSKRDKGKTRGRGDELWRGGKIASTSLTVNSTHQNLCVWFAGWKEWLSTSTCPKYNKVFCFGDCKLDSDQKVIVNFLPSFINDNRQQK